ncbi:pentapeptide repeat-containing protein [Actinoplanes sp. NPDC000266]
MGGILTVLVLAVGLYETNRNNNAAQNAATRQLQLATKQQVAQRLTDAVEQLGQEDQKDNDKLSVRIGAIVSLQRLMTDFPEDERAILQILAAFVRTHATRPAAKLVALPSPPDVIAAVVVIGERTEHPNSNTPKHSVDTAGSFLALPPHSSALQGLNLAGMSLPGAYLHWAELDSAILRRSNLRYANFTMASLEHVDLQFANLYRADFTEAELEKTNFADANLAHADLRDADFGGTIFEDAALPFADLRGADLTHTDIETWQLQCALIDTATLLPVDAVRPPVPLSKDALATCEERYAHELHYS